MSDRECLKEGVQRPVHWTCSAHDPHLKDREDSSTLGCVADRPHTFAGLLSGCALEEKMEFLAFPNPSSFFQLLPRRPPIMAFLSHVLHLSNVLKRSPLVFKDDAPLPACPPRGPINITERGVGKRSATNHEMSDSGHVIEHYVEDRQIFALWDSEEMNLRS